MRHGWTAPGIMTRMSETVVIVGGGVALGARVAALAAADPSVEVTRLDLADPAMKDVLSEADVVVHLGAADTIGPDGLPAAANPAEDVASTRVLLEAAASVGVTRLVVLSSAMVYGAWANNPVPLTEEAPLRPDPGLPYAAARAEIERLALDWREDRDTVTVAVLRPVVSVAAESAAWLAASPWSASALRALGRERPSQFLHLDDLASAIDHARSQSLDGPFNVSPDGWLPFDALAELAGPVGRLHLPSGLKGRLVALRAEIGTAGPPEGWSYTRHPWVVANDRLRATGWVPRHRNEEVYVEADPGGPLASLSARRRQELSLALAAGFIVVGIGAAAWAIRRGRRR